MSGMNRFAQTLEDQRRAADPAASVWVSANAGAGKTHVLINRVIRLLLSGTPPERILCLTFTKAAASEMAARLYRELGSWAVLEDGALAQKIEALDGGGATPARLKAARLLFARAIETPGGLKIQTIHAFCERLLGRFPLEAGVPPHFDILDERATDEYMAEAQHALLEEIGEDDLAGHETPLTLALSHVSRVAGEFGFETLFKAIVGERGRIHRFLERAGGLEAAIEQLRVALGVKEGVSERGLIADALSRVPRARIGEAADVLAGGTVTDRKKEAIFRAFLAERDEAAAFSLYCSAFLKATDGEPFKDLVTKKLREANGALEEELRAEQSRIHDLTLALNAVRVAEASEAMLRLGDALLASYESIKRIYARLDYEDLIERARALLTNRQMTAWVLYKLDGGLDHILVDEAQDTSPAQWEVIAALADEFMSGSGARETVRTVFAVGDEKQSIYSFQGAAPEKFSAMRAYFEKRVKEAEGTWSPVHLLLSFRSVPEVLNAVDLVFKGEAARAGLSVEDDPVAHYARREEEGGLVELWPLEEPEEEEEENPWDAPLDYPTGSSPRARLAARIADQVAEWLQNGERLHANGRKIKPGDIMVLVRRRDLFVEEMIRALKARAIPVAGADRMMLAEQIAVMDLLSLGRFALLPEDDLTLAEVLKSPLIGFSEEELFDLAYGRTVSLWGALIKRAEEKPAFAKAYAYLSHVLAEADQRRPYEFYARRLIGERGREKLLARLGEDVNDPVDEFLSLALQYEQGHAGALQGFLHWIETGHVQIKRDLDQGANEVRVMTVHGAKGLEAPIVFLPDTCAVPAARFDPVLLPAQHRGEDLPLWPVRKANDEALAGAAREKARALQGEEYRRLLYVAMTRARDRLYVCGHKGAKKLPDACWYALIQEGLKDALEPVETPRGTVWRKEGKRAAPAGDSVTAEALPPLPAWAHQPAPEEAVPPRPLAPSRFEGEAGAEPPVLSPLGGDTQKRFKRGRIIHRLLETLPEIDAEKWDAAAARFLAAPGHDLSEAERKEIWQAARAVLEAPDFKALFGPGSRAEVPVVGIVETPSGPLSFAGQIDRLVEREGEILIVDYKTIRPAPKTPGEVSPAYIAQLAAYRALLAQSRPGFEVRCALLWTDGPRLMEIPAENLEKYLR